MSDDPTTRVVGGVAYRAIGRQCFQNPADQWDIRHTLELDAMEIRLPPCEGSWLLYGYLTTAWHLVPRAIFTALLDKQLLIVAPLGVTRLGKYWCDQNHLTTPWPSQERGEGGTLSDP